uniref:N-alpha-acetyltransferase 25, NatB auxiliary subunit n=1 Tax=Aceria tosichella TaxID=561515 RepID=A0A6G1SB13_9ACAR
MSSAGNNPAVFERQLKKIYDCLNIGSNKKAVQEVDRLPNNVRDSTVFKALKALALIRMGKRSQAFDILGDIDPKKDLDEVTLQTMTSCYKESVDIGKIVDLYEAAAARKPNDPEIMSHLFMAHVRVFNFKRQKEIALQMYKTFAKKKRLYSFWAIMSLVMQSQQFQPDNQDHLSPDKKICLSLAEKMCEKMIDDERSHEEIELYLMILRMQHKHEEEYRFLTGQYCLRITDHLSWYNRRRAYLCLDLKMYSRAFKHYFPTLIQEYPDQIEYYQGLFKSAFLLDTEAPSQQQPVAINDQQSIGANQPASTPVKSSSALAECFDIVEKQCQLAIDTTDSIKQEQSKNKNQNPTKSLSRTSSLHPNRRRLLRGPFIARIELYNTVLSNESNLPKNIYSQCMNQFSSKYPTLASILLDFFQSFSKKIICYYDLDYMINRYKLPSVETARLLGFIDSWISKDLCEKQSTIDINPYDMFHIFLNYHMLEHSLTAYKISDSRENRLKLAKKYIDLYNENRDLGKPSKTEFLPVDHYCLLAINSVMTNAIDSNLSTTPQSILNDRTLISLIVMAENAAINSHSNHQIKLLLLKLYSFIGASKQSSNVLLALDIKHFQIDTLGHLLNPALYSTGNYTLAKESLETCLEFYAHGVRECCEGLTTSYRDGKYSKIKEISGVLKRLSDSLNAAQCVLLKGIVSNLNAATITDLIGASQSFDPFKGLYRLFRCPSQMDTIKDSRDFKVLKSIHFEVNELVQNRRHRTLEDENLWLRLRYFLLRCVYLQVEVSVVKKSQTEKDTEEFEYSLSEIDSLVPKIRDRLNENTDDTNYSYLEPEASPFRWQNIKFEPLVSMVRLLIACTSTKSSLAQEIYDKYFGYLDEIAGDIESQLSSINSLVAMRKTLMLLTISSEFISLCVTSLVCIIHESGGSGIGSQATSPAYASVKSQSNQQAPQQSTSSKSKSLVHQMASKTGDKLGKISNMIKGVDLKSMVADKIVQVDETLLCDAKHCTGSESEKSPPIPLMSPNYSEILVSKVKEKIFDSYNDSLREIEAALQRKAKLLAKA